jgi:hypothetical protein
MSQNMSENSANDMQIKSQHLSELESLFDNQDLDCVVILGAHILFPANATLAQVSAVREFFSDLVDKKIEEKISGLL